LGDSQAVAVLKDAVGKRISAIEPLTPTTDDVSERGVVPSTTSQQLASLVKSAQGIMRKDKGHNGDLDRLPMLTWLVKSIMEKEKRILEIMGEIKALLAEGPKG
jgi:hypothetical protein